jgi:hypothetical protein
LSDAGGNSQAASVFVANLRLAEPKQVEISRSAAELEYLSGHKHLQTCDGEPSPKI